MVDPIASEVVFGWPEVLQRLAPSRSVQALNLLRLVRSGWYVGTRVRNGAATTFVLDAAGKSSAIGEVLRKNPGFEKELVEVFYVESVEWDAQLAEAV